MTCWPLYCLYQTGPNCWRACVATLLRVGLDDLPGSLDSASRDERSGSQLQETRRVLRERGLDLVREKPEQTTIRPAPEGVDGELVIVGVRTGGPHAIVALDVDGVFFSLWDPDCGEPRAEYPLEDVTRVVPWR